MPLKPTIIIAASMPRSGSTWLVNAAKEVLISDPNIAKNFSFGWIYDLPNIPEKPVMLLKVHDFNPEILKVASFIFYSYRDIRDALASHARCFGTTPTIEDADGARDNYEKWVAHAHYVVKYEDMMNQKLSIIRELAKRFSIQNINETEILERLNRLENAAKDDQKYSKENLYHKNHITNGKHGTWHAQVDKNLENQIVNAHKDWFVKNGYPT